MALGKVIAALFAEKASAKVQQHASVQKLARETAKLERQGLRNVTSLAAAAIEEMGKDIHSVVSWVTSSNNKSSGDDDVAADKKKIGTTTTTTTTSLKSAKDEDINQKK